MIFSKLKFKIKLTRDTYACTLSLTDTFHIQSNVPLKCEKKTYSCLTPGVIGRQSLNRLDFP